MLLRNPVENVESIIYSLGDLCRNEWFKLVLQIIRCNFNPHWASHAHGKIKLNLVNPNLYTTSQK